MPPRKAKNLMPKRKVRKAASTRQQLEERKNGQRPTRQVENMIFRDLDKKSNAEFKAEREHKTFQNRRRIQKATSDAIKAIRKAQARRKTVVNPPAPKRPRIRPPVIQPPVTVPDIIVRPVRKQRQPSPPRRIIRRKPRAKSVEEKAAEKKAAEQRAAEQKAAEQKSAIIRDLEDRTGDEKMVTLRKKRRQARIEHDRPQHPPDPFGGGISPPPDEYNGNQASDMKSEEKDALQQLLRALEGNDDINRGVATELKNEPEVITGRPAPFMPRRDDRTDDRKEEKKVEISAPIEEKKETKKFARKRQKRNPERKEEKEQKYPIPDEKKEKKKFARKRQKRNPDGKEELKNPRIDRDSLIKGGQNVTSQKGLYYVVCRKRAGKAKGARLPHDDIKDSHAGDSELSSRRPNDDE